MFWKFPLYIWFLMFYMQFSWSAQHFLNMWLNVLHQSCEILNNYILTLLFSLSFLLRKPRFVCYLNFYYAKSLILFPQCFYPFVSVCFILDINSDLPFSSRTLSSSLSNLLLKPFIKFISVILTFNSRISILFFFYSSVPLL